MITQTRSFQTSDNKLFTNKTEALNHEFKLELKGLIRVNGNAPKNDCFTTDQVASILVSNSPEIVKVINRYKEAIRRASQNQNA